MGRFLAGRKWAGLGALLRPERALRFRIPFARIASDARHERDRISWLALRVATATVALGCAPPSRGLARLHPRARVRAAEERPLPSRSPFGVRWPPRALCSRFCPLGSATTSRSRPQPERNRPRRGRSSTSRGPPTERGCHARHARSRRPWFERARLRRAQRRARRAEQHAVQQRLTWIGSGDRTRGALDVWLATSGRATLASLRVEIPDLVVPFLYTATLECHPGTRNQTWWRQPICSSSDLAPREVRTRRPSGLSQTSRAIAPADRPSLERPAPSSSPTSRSPATGAGRDCGSSSRRVSCRWARGRQTRFETSTGRRRRRRPRVRRVVRDRRTRACRACAHPSCMQSSRPARDPIESTLMERCCNCPEFDFGMPFNVGRCKAPSSRCSSAQS